MGKRGIATVTFAIFLTTLMSTVEGTITLTAMPTIVPDLDGLEIMSWAVSTFLLTIAISAPLYGKVVDRFGRKPALLSGIFIFVLGSCLYGLSQSILQLTTLKAVQGLGSGAAQPVVITMPADIYPLDRRTEMTGLNSSLWGLVSIIVPLFGGFIVQHLTWHWVSYVNLPFGILAFLLVSFFSKEEIIPKEGELDLQETIFLVSFSLVFMLFLQGLGKKYLILILGVSVVLNCTPLVLFERAK